MGANRAILLLVVVCCSVAPPLSRPLLATQGGNLLAAQTAPRKPAHPPAAAVASAVLLREAEAAIDQQDFAAAEPKLLQATLQDPKDYRAWFDLGFVYSSTDRKQQAIDAYRKSVELKPDVFESNLNLGVLLAAAGDPEAEKYLRAATMLKPVLSKPEEGQARAWMALGMLLGARRPAEAIRAYEAASRLTPSDPAPYVEAGVLWEKQGDFDEAEKAFRAAVKINPDSAQAYVGLANVYTRTKQLQGAAAALRQLVRLRPNDVNAHLQLGRILRELGYPAVARPEFESASRLAPADAAILRELASLDALENRPQALEEYRDLVRRQPEDAELRYALGSLLLKQRAFPEAEEQLLAAVRLKPDLGDAYGELAVAAAENKHYELAVRALDQRARYLPESPGTYFLRATSYDNLRAYPQAADAYHQFLAAAGGKYPDQEWQARHRLIAIEPKGKRKK